MNVSPYPSLTSYENYKMQKIFSHQTVSTRIVANDSNIANIEKYTEYLDNAQQF